MSNVDLLLEKWLTGFKKYGHLIDIFENPTKKDLSELNGKWRFIADARTKKVYVWNAMGAIHADAWGVLRKDVDSALPILYKHPALLPGTYDDGAVVLYAADYMSHGIRKGIQQQDWTFLHSYMGEKGTKSLEDALNRL